MYLHILSNNFLRNLQNLYKKLCFKGKKHNPKINCYPKLNKSMDQKFILFDGKGNL